MGELAELLKNSYEIFRGNEGVVVTQREGHLGMAYAIPRGTEDTVVDTYGPWDAAELKQVFYEQSFLVNSVLAEIQLIMSWKISQARQYIIEAYLEKRVISLDPTVSVSISVRFDQPQNYDGVLEAYRIPFVVEVDFRPVGSNKTVLFAGELRADGTGTFEPSG